MLTPVFRPVSGQTRKLSASLSMGPTTTQVEDHKAQRNRKQGANFHHECGWRCVGMHSCTETNKPRDNSPASLDVGRGKPRVRRGQVRDSRLVIREARGHLAIWSPHHTCKTNNYDKAPDSIHTSIYINTASNKDLKMNVSISVKVIHDQTYEGARRKQAAWRTGCR